MYSKKQLETAFETDLRAVLEHFGFNHIKDSYFEHPFKTEKSSPSFSVFYSKNKIWLANDFSNGVTVKVWRVLELVMKMKNWTFKETIKFLLSFDGHYSEGTESNFSFQNKNNEVQPLPKHKEATQKQINSLNYYLKKERGISPSLAKQYLKYVQYQHKGKTYYSLWFANNSKGFAVRNSIFKACFVSSDITTIEKENFDNWIVFEGFMDYLSAITYYKRELKANVLVLNSTTNTQKGIDYILDKMTLESEISCFLDNDRAGKEAFVEISGQFADANVFDYSEKLYGEKDEKGNYKYKDFNEFLTKNKEV